MVEKELLYLYATRHDCVFIDTSFNVASQTLTTTLLLQITYYNKQQDGNIRSEDDEEAIKNMSSMRLYARQKTRSTLDENIVSDSTSYVKLFQHQISCNEFGRMRSFSPSQLT